MAKADTVYICQNCEYQSSKWVGQCPSCGEWNTLVETVNAVKKTAGSQRKTRSSRVRLSEVVASKHFFSRFPTGIEEFDRVLGGGVVLGSVSLIGGEPGIGKSTLLTQIVINILKNEDKEYRVIYICGEESPEQIALRVRRMMGGKDAEAAVKERITFLLSTDVDECIAEIEAEKPNLVIVDSIQSMQTEDLTGTTGSVGQLKETTQRLARMAKSLHIPVFLVGHVTKDGAIAGPKILEHIVDTVLELSGERTGFFRILRSMKNRFGATDEVGVFQVVEAGLREVKNPSQLFLEESQKGAAGSSIVPVLEGTRPVLVEIQALVVDSQLAIPRRVGRGVALPRIQLLAAVLQKHCGIPLGTMDIFINVAGGFTIHEPGADLGIAMAIASSYKNTPLPNDTAYIGEIGLLGEVRTVSMVEKRSKEAQRLGYTRVVSSSTAKHLSQLVRQLRRRQ